MGRITGVTKKVVDNYYKEKKVFLNEELNKIIDKIKKEKIKEFENDKTVKQIKELLNIVENKYGISLDLKLYGYMVKYNEDKEYITKLNEIKNIDNERDMLLVILDNYPKTSEKYKDSINKLNEIIGG